MTATSCVKQFNFTESQVAKLMRMQDELNTYIHPEWKAQNFDWATAIVDEGQEILGHLGWKWWKDKTYQQGVIDSNKDQIKLELIDILHFVMSNAIENNCTAFNFTWDMNRHCTTVGRNIYQTVKKMQELTLRNDASPYELVILMHCLDMTEQEIIETYTQKYVLNKFRQDHGYKDGSYVKEWHMPTNPGSFIVRDYLEDNEVLAAIVKRFVDCDIDSTDETALYNALELSYNSRLNK